MRISDWSSDVCSSDLVGVVTFDAGIAREHRHLRDGAGIASIVARAPAGAAVSGGRVPVSGRGMAAPTKKGAPVGAPSVRSSPAPDQWLRIKSAMMPVAIAKIGREHV